MNDRSSNLLDNVTPVALPRRRPGASGRKPAGLAPRPALPRRTIPLTARPLARELADQGWDQAA